MAKLIIDNKTIQYDRRTGVLTVLADGAARDFRPTPDDVLDLLYGSEPVADAVNRLIAVT